MTAQGRPTLINAGDDMTPTERTRTLAVPRGSHTLAATVTAPPTAAAPWLIFSNSLMTDLGIWDAQAEILSKRFGILRYDQVGHGGSERPASTVNFDILGADLLAVMDAAGVDRAVGIGLSMGVPTMLAAHAAQPQRFTALVLSDGQSRTAPGGGGAWADRIAAAERDGMSAFAQATADRWLTESAGPECRARLIDMIAATPFEGFRACARALMDYDYSDRLRHIDIPVLLIAGQQDGAMPEGMATKLKPEIAGSEMVVIPDAGHVPCFEQPAAFNAALDRFLSRIGDAALRGGPELNVK